jgi:2-oxoisovalerate dehydrogenase E2 component (dihydrolipoyl transacylase)
MSDYIFKLPDLGEGTVESEIGEWHVSVGDHVDEEDIVGTMMTDKAAVELSSPVSGTVVSLAGEPGDVVSVGSPLIVFSLDGNSASAAPPDAAGKSRPAPEKPDAESASRAAGNGSRQKPDGKVVTSPAIRRMAKEAGIDLSQVSGSGTGGRILRADFEAFAKQQHKAVSSRRTASEPSEVKIIGLRRMIAERMTAAKREIPHFSYVEETDITEVSSRNAVSSAALPCLRSRRLPACTASSASARA